MMARLPLLMQLLESEHSLKGNDPVDKRPDRTSCLSCDPSLKAGFRGFPAVSPAFMATHPPFAEGLAGFASDGRNREYVER
jgi:hypothetical protein